jgi:hypothetical protein
MFGGVTGDVLIAGPDARLAPTRYEHWTQTPDALADSHLSRHSWRGTRRS